MERFFFALGAALAALSVAAGIFGVYELQSAVSADSLIMWEKAVRYQMYHAIALIFIAWGITQWWNRANTLRAAGWFFTLGTALFSGGLYLLVLKGNLTFNIIQLSYIPPTGGVALILGWLTLMIAAWRE
ncbi:MAG: DUF423 domain-containing protein [Chloroflexota bacterium]|nr:DUF423 domain-containing protein [Chloroflexota bacterium]